LLQAIVEKVQSLRYQTELHAVIQEIVGKETQRIDAPTLRQITQDASMAQAKYIVNQCERNMGLASEKSRKSGKWVLPNVLDSRDVVLQWSD